MSQFVDVQTELRHLSATARRNLEQMLDSGDNWKMLSSVIPRSLDTLSFERQMNEPSDNRLISSANFSLLDQQKYVLNGSSASKALLDYWSTFGRQRPTVGHLIQCLQLAGLDRVAQYTTDQILSSSKTIAELIDLQSSQSNEESSWALIDQADLTQFELSTLSRATNQFDDQSVTSGGRKLGEGGFGFVYLGYVALSSNRTAVAVKRLRAEFGGQLNNEIHILSRLKHDRLLRLIGVCWASPRSVECLVYEYMINGSLQDRIKEKHPQLNIENRLRIACDVAEALCFLHNQTPKALVHRDVKSANVLLTDNFRAKLGDFGLARNARPNEMSTRTVNVIGTSVYMAPEAFKG